ncbi:MAG TPA: acyl-CoA thioesterase II [Alteraurantiacibacter sp.]
MADTAPPRLSPEELVSDLVELLNIQPAGQDERGEHFTGRRKKGGVGRVFGGQVIAQALGAAEHTVEDDRQAHSLHAYFLRGGSEDHEIDFRVRRDFDGGSFSNRRVVASQQGRPILSLTASFQRQQEGLTHQTPQMPDVPAPETLEPDEARRMRLAEHLKGRVRQFALLQWPIETRSVGEPQWLAAGPKEPISHAWFRAAAALPDDERIHRAVLAYASDMQLLGTATLPHGKSMWRGELKLASLDHAIWFHAPFRADEWLLYATQSPWSGGARGFAQGQIFNQDGRLVASVAQEGMMREA